MKVKLHDMVKELEKENFKLAVRTEGDGVLLVVTNPRRDGAEDHVATLNLHNNVVGCYEEDVFWDAVGLYRHSQKQQDAA
ncbi:hypothetical protein [Bradyrhizobium liaoningense]|uniref:hypothetical protein n=1 Tax=Bradyrhizobium liaoningense TaxID=43992 RepID=UPI001BA8A543|nr:hypothetical protein [Bradyrhizobium liaoningense]MBR0822421.1 hypothetical protein [Bradyrhizobium liaoningense]